MLLDNRLEKSEILDTRPSQKVNISWFYPHICSFQDTIEDRGAFFDFFNRPPAPAKQNLLYIHIPFCQSFCGYCGCFKEKFGAFTYEDRVEFCHLLVREMEMKSATSLLKGTKIHYISFGGGTPSILENELYQIIFDGIAKCWDISELEGVALEGNISSLIEPERVETLAEVGVTRFSFGVQSFDRKLRKQMSVAATDDQIEGLGKRIHAAGRPFAIDLIFNQPGQTLQMFQDDLDEAYRIGSDYVHTYLFNQYPSTWLDDRIKDAKYDELPSAEKEIDMWNLLMDSHAANGYTNQMIINFFGNNPKPHKMGMELQMGMNRLNGSNVIGIGPGSFSYIEGNNFKNYRNVRRYMDDIKAGEYPADIGIVTSEDELKHRVMVYFPIFTRMRKADVPDKPIFGEILDRLVAEEFAEEVGEEIKLTRKGMVWAGNIAQLFYSDYQSRYKLKSYYFSVKHAANPFNTDRMNVNKKGLVPTEEVFS